MNFLKIITFLVLLISCSKEQGHILPFEDSSSLSEEESLRLNFRKNGIGKVEFQKENEELVDLGRNLFFDKILSGNKNISCATCHHPELGTSDSLALSIGEGGIGLGEDREKHEGEFVPRNSPHLFNLGMNDLTTLMWDGRIAITQEEGILSPEIGINGKDPRLKYLTENIDHVLTLQAFFPVTSNDEMLGKFGSNEISNLTSNEDIWEALTNRVVEIPEYQDKLKDAYGDQIEEFNYSHIARAIAAFERDSFTLKESRFDKFMNGDNTALTSREKAGARLFTGKARCVQCHNGSNFSDENFYSLSTPQKGPGKGQIDQEDIGRANFSKKLEDKYKFKTPPLRNIALSAPYFHSGSHHSLEAVIRHHLNPKRSFEEYLADPSNSIDNLDYNVDRNIARLNSLDSFFNVLIVEEFSDLDIENIELFLRTLTDESFKDKIETPSRVPSGLEVDQI